MKTASRFMALAVCASLAMPLPAQTPVTPAPASTPPPGASQQGGKSFSQGELDQLLAPIALYPDALLAQVLMASTYPLQVVEAARWQKANPTLKDKALEDALQQQQWDPAVKSLVVFPQVLTMMNEKLDWTQKLGDAFLAQQQDVLATAQELRKKAQAQGALKDTEQQKVVTAQENNTTVIKIEPTNPEVVYVPTYNPTVVYGAWGYPAYPPYYYYPPGYVAGGALLGFTAGVIVGGALWGNCNWGRGDVNVNVNRYNNFNRTNISNGNWQHNAANRGGVPYRDQNVAQQYGRGQNANAASREQFRGRAEAGQQSIQRGEVSRDSVNRAQQAGGQRDLGGAGGGQRDFGGASASQRDYGNRGGGASAFETRGGGAQTRDYSNRGASSMNSARSAGNMQRSSGGGGAARAGGGGGGARGGGGGRGGRR
ncbi:MAG: DUF3300 domain-containing protein [Burkholderiales bacterium]